MNKVVWKDRDITGLVLSVTVEHTLGAAGREARVQALYVPEDGRFTPLNPACGDSVTVTAAEKELFAGQVERVEWDSAGMRLELVCLESSARLAKNESYRAFSGTPKEIATQLCHLCDLTVGSLWDKQDRVFLPPTCGKSLFSLLREAYGGDCVTESRNDALVVRPVGEETYLLKDGKAYSLTAEHSCEDSVTGAAVISQQGNVLSEVIRPEWESVIGRRRRAYVSVGAQSGAETQALAHLSGVKQSGRLVLVGDPALRCGDNLQLGLGQYGLAGIYRIRWVSHRLEAGVFTTTLGVMGL